MTDAQNRKLMGYILLTCALATAWAAFLDEKVHGSRRWVMLIAASVFVLVGLQVVTAATKRLSALIGGFVCVGLSSVGFYVAFSHEKLSGGIPFIPEAWNQSLGHGLFGFGALITGAMAIYFFVKAVRHG